MPLAQETTIDPRLTRCVTLIQRNRATQIGEFHISEQNAPQNVAPNDLVVCLSINDAEGNSQFRTFTFSGSEVFVATTSPMR